MQACMTDMGNPWHPDDVAAVRDKLVELETRIRVLESQRGIDAGARVVQANAGSAMQNLHGDQTQHQFSQRTDIPASKVAESLGLSPEDAARLLKAISP